MMHVLTSLEIGGAEMLVVRLIEAIDQDRFEPSVTCLRRRGALADRLTDLGVLVECPAVPADQGAVHLGLALRRVVGRHRPDVLHTHNVSPLAASAWALAGQPSIRLVHTKHGRSTAHGVVGRAAAWWAARRATAIVAVSRDAAEQAIHEEHVARSRVRVIMNGVDLPPSIRRDRAPTRAITVARLEAVKDQVTMLRAVPTIVAALPSFHLDIVGDGGERAHLEATVDRLGVRDHVTFHGFQTDVSRYLAAADIFLLSSVSEGISLTLLEAMASGLPVVATAVGGNPEVVVAGVTGLLVAPSDPAALAAATLTLTGDPATAAAMGAAGRARVADRFGSAAMVEAYSRLYLGDAD